MYARIETSRRTEPPRSIDEEDDDTSYCTSNDDFDEDNYIDIGSSSSRRQRDRTSGVTVVEVANVEHRSLPVVEVTPSVAASLPPASRNKGGATLSRSQSHSRKKSSVSVAIVQAKETPPKKERQTKKTKNQANLDKIVCKKSDGDEMNYNKLVTLAINDKVDAFKRGLEASGLHPDYSPNMSTTFLAWATEFGAEKVVRFLVTEPKVNIHFRTGKYLHEGNSGYSVIIIAADKCRKDMLKLYIEKGGDVNDVNDRGETALMHVAYQAVKEQAYTAAYIEIMKILLAAGANINARDDIGSTALMFSMYPEDCFGKCPGPGPVAVIDALLAGGADINQAGAGGMTVLHFVCDYNREDLAVILLDKGADPDIRDEEGRTAWHLLENPSFHAHYFFTKHSRTNNFQVVGATSSRKSGRRAPVSPAVSSSKKRRSGGSGTYV